MNKIITLISCIFLTAALSAQTTSTLRGKLIDSLNKQSLKDASITALNGTDSSLEVFTLARQDGSFSLANIPFGLMIIQIKFRDMNPSLKKLLFPKQTKWLIWELFL